MQRLLILLGLCAFIAAEYVDQPCKKGDPNLSDCFRYRLKNGREIIASKVDPWYVKEHKFEQTVSDLVWMKALVKNAKITGFKNTIIDDFKVNEEKLTTELRITIPFMTFETEYETAGQLLIIPVQSKGFFKGNFTDIKMFFRGHFSLNKKGNEEHYKLEKLEYVSRVGDGVVKMISKNPELQFSADLIANFFNENPRRVMDAINPIYIKQTAIFYKNWANEILAKVPANHILN